MSTAFCPYHHHRLPDVLCTRCQARPTAKKGPPPSTLTRICMRFGCGARLSLRAPGDMCETCTDAGYIRPLPAQVLAQKCAAEERTRMRQPLDIVHTLSLLQKAAAVVAAEDRNAQGEAEDVAVVASILPESLKVEETTPTEDHELVCRRDTEPTQVLPPKLRTKLRQASTLRDLSFTDGPRTIPKAHAVLADETLPHRFDAPGRDDVLLLQTRMDCRRCTLATTDSSTEEREVSGILEATSDADDVVNFLPPASSPNKNSSNGLGDALNFQPIPGWESDLTELSDDGSRSTSDSDVDFQPGPPGDTTGLSIRVPLLVHRLPSDASLRKCGNRRCNIALPEDCRWKTCDPCRRAQRVYQSTRLENKRRNLLGIEALESSRFCRRWRSLSPEACGTDTLLTAKASRPCAVKHCQTRIPLPDIYQWKTCVGCRAKARRRARQKRDARIEAQHASHQADVAPHFPTYQNRDALLSSFDAQLKGFVEGLIVYLRAKLHESETRGRSATMKFVFIGEYSIVTGQRDGEDEDEDGAKDRDDRESNLRSPDDPEASATMRREVSRVVVSLERALHTKFSAVETFAIDTGGIIMRFKCSLELIAQLRPLRTLPFGSGSGRRICGDEGKDACREDLSPSPLPLVPLVKTLSGELEAVVVPDVTHCLFHGRRTAIRYCMLG